MKISNFKFQIYNITPLIVIILAVLLRLVPHVPNFTPVAAMALFGGVYLSKRLAFIFPLVVMFVSDMFLGFHQSMPYVYIGFFLTVLLGFAIRQKPSFFKVAGMTFLSAIVFFLITNWGFFLTNSLYPKTFSGQMSAYFMALPFFRNSLLGDFFYTGLFFGSYFFVKTIFYKKGVVGNANIYKKRG